jgi:hypothetical protein
LAGIWKQNPACGYQKLTHSKEIRVQTLKSVTTVCLCSVESASQSTTTKLFSTSKLPRSGKYIQAETETKQSQRYCPLLYYSVQSGKHQRIVEESSVHTVRVEVISYTAHCSPVHISVRSKNITRLSRPVLPLTCQQ